MSRATYQHDCSDCRFLGPHTEDGQTFDLYYCTAAPLELKKGEHNAGTIIARHGDDTGDVISLTISQLRRHEQELRGQPEYRPVLAGFDQYLHTTHEIEDVNVRGWQCQLYFSPLGFVTIRTLDDDIELFVDCVPESGALDMKAMQAGAKRAISMMRDRIEQELLRRRRRWRKR